MYNNGRILDKEHWKDIPKVTDGIFKLNKSNPNQMELLDCKSTSVKLAKGWKKVRNHCFLYL